MMKKTRRKLSSTSLLDMLFNLLLGFIILTIVAFLQVKPLVKKADIKTKAEYIITVTWDKGNLDDVDTWLQDPTKEIVYYRDKEMGLSHIDRDDRGNVNDDVLLPDGTKVKNPYNQEITSIRGFISGEWILNVHMFDKRENKPTIVRVKIEKINPVVKLIWSKDVILFEKNDEETICRFTMNQSGETVSIDEMPAKLVEKRIISDMNSGAFNRATEHYP